MEDFRKLIFKKAFSDAGYNKETFNDKIREVNSQGISIRGGFTRETVMLVVEWLVEEFMPLVCEKYRKRCIDEAMPSGDNGQMSPAEMAKEVLRATVQSAREGKPASQLAAGKMLGMITDKQEIKHELKYAPEHYLNIGRRAIEQLRDDYRRYGVCSVCGQSPVLLGEVREDKGQDEGNHTLPVVDSSDIPF